jgi:hypothetical protein
MRNDKVSGAVTVAAEPQRARGGIRRRWIISQRQPIGGQALVLQHSDHEPGGVLLDVLRDKLLEPIVVRVDQSSLLPDPESVQLAVVLGSAQQPPSWPQRLVAGCARCVNHDAGGFT